MACITHQVTEGWLPLQAVQGEGPDSTKKPIAPADGDLKLVYNTAVTDLPDRLQEVKPCKMAQGGLHAENLSIVSISLPAAIVSHQTAFKVMGLNRILLWFAIPAQIHPLYSQCNVTAQPTPAESRGVH